MLDLDSSNLNSVQNDYFLSIHADDSFVTLYANSDKYPKLDSYIELSENIKGFVKLDGKNADYIIHNSTLKFGNQYLNELVGYTTFALDNGNIVSLDIFFNFYYWKTQFEGIEWIAKYSPAMFLNKLLISLKDEFNEKSIQISEAENPLDKSLDLHLQFEVTQDTTFEEIINPLRDKIESMANLVVRELDNVIWQHQFESNEVLFQRDFLNPLFRKMNFYDMYLNHGRGEHGKDFILVEIDKFQNVVYTSVQVKKGNLRGSDRKEIGILAEQALSSFQVPYEYPKTNERVYISKYIVVVSGIITDEARKELLYRIDKNFRPLVSFLDKNDLLKLFNKYASK